MAPSHHSLWELFPIGRSPDRTNPHHRKAGPGRKHLECRRNRANKPINPPQQRLAPALGIGDWKGQRYLSYHAHDAQRAWKGTYPPTLDEAGRLQLVNGPGNYLRTRCGVDTQHMDEADIFLRFLDIMKRLAELHG